MASPYATDATAAGWSARRADARRNHERIVAAALEVFAERGLVATIPEVAARAGVGKATVYRSYPRKADLIDAVARHQLQWLEQRASAALAEPAPYNALRTLLGDMFERLSTDRVLVDVLPAGRGSENPPHVQRSLEMIGQLLDAARADRRIRDDATLQDIRILFGGCARQLTLVGNHNPAVWRRYAELVLNALRP
jgi:AcrR family transcriptional regulator